MAGRNLISNSRKIIQLVFSVMPVNVKVVHFVAENTTGIRRVSSLLIYSLDCARVNKESFPLELLNGFDQTHPTVRARSIAFRSPRMFPGLLRQWQSTFPCELRSQRSPVPLGRTARY